MEKLRIVLYADEFSKDVWEEYCDICGEDSSAISLTIRFVEEDCEAEYLEDDEERDDNE